MTVLEKADNLRTQGATVALLANGWRALDALSIGDELRVHAPLFEEFASFIMAKCRLLQNLLL